MPTQFKMQHKEHTSDRTNTKCKENTKECWQHQPWQTIMEQPTYDVSIFYDMGEVARNSTKEDEATEVRHGMEKLPKEKNTMNSILSATNISNDGIIEIYAEVCRWYCYNSFRILRTFQFASLTKCIRDLFKKFLVTSSCMYNLRIRSVIFILYIEWIGCLADNDHSWWVKPRHLVKIECYLHAAKGWRNLLHAILLVCVCVYVCVRTRVRDDDENRTFTDWWCYDDDRKVVCTKKCILSTSTPSQQQY